MTSIGEWIAAGATKVFNVFKVGAANIVSRVLATFGLSLVSINSLLPGLKSFLENYLTSLPPNVLDFMGAIGLDVFMSMILSALVVQVTTRTFLMPTSAVNAIRGMQQ